MLFHYLRSKKNDEEHHGEETNLNLIRERRASLKRCVGWAIASSRAHTPAKKEDSDGGISHAR